MSWLFFLIAIMFLVSYATGSPFCIKHIANGKITRIYMHLKGLVKLQVIEHGRQNKLALVLPKGLVTRLNPIMGYHFHQQVRQWHSNLKDVSKKATIVVG